MKKRKKFLGYCENCRKSLCEEHAYFLVDGNNEAITDNSPYLCDNCYQTEYGVKIESDVERFRKKLIKSLLRYKETNKLDTIKIKNLIKYIEVL